MTSIARCALLSAVVFAGLCGTAHAAALTAGSVLLSSHNPGTSGVRYSLTVAPRSLTQPVRAVGVLFCSTPSCSVVAVETGTSASTLVHDGTPNAVRQGADPYGSGWYISSRSGNGYIGMRSYNVPSTAPAGPLRFAFDGLTNRAASQGWVRIMTFGTTAYSDPIDSYTVPYALDGAGQIQVSASGTDPSGGCTPSPGGAPFRTITKALACASPGQTIDVGPGTYPAFTDSATPRSQPVTVRGVGLERPEVGLGATSVVTQSNLKLESLDLGRVSISENAGRTPRTTANVMVRGSTLTAGQDHTGGTCVDLVGSLSAITIEDSWIHDCIFGVAGNGGSTGAQTGLTIRRNLLERFCGDGVHLQHAGGVQIAGNEIRDMNKAIRGASGTPAPEYPCLGSQHNDGIQFLGDIQGAQITGNLIHDSQHQGLLVKSEPSAPESSSAISLVNNVIYDTGAYAVAVEKTAGLQLLHNTLWYSRVNASVSYGTGISDMSVFNNILYRMDDLSAGAVVPSHGYNFVYAFNGKTAWNARPASSLYVCGFNVSPPNCQPEPGFRSLVTTPGAPSDLRLQPTSRGIDMAKTSLSGLPLTPVLADVTTDVDGRTRFDLSPNPPEPQLGLPQSTAPEIADIGAYEYTP